MSTRPTEHVVLVDAEDRPIGEAEKVACHRHPVPLHRAISVFLFDGAGRMLLTQRSTAKATWPGVWSNACCTHPRPSEETADAAVRRVREELGVEAELTRLFHFTYEARWDEVHGEHELDHVFIGRLEAEPRPDDEEIADWRLLEVSEVLAALAKRPDELSPWFRLCVGRVLGEARRLGLVGGSGPA